MSFFLSNKWPELAMLAVLCALPALDESFMLDLASRIIVFSILAVSLELLVGTTGLVSLGHAAFFGIGAYAGWAVSLHPASNVLLVLMGSVAAASLYALVAGALVLRTKGVYFIMVTLAFAQMAYFIFHDTALGGGSDGVYLPRRPGLLIGEWTVFDADSPVNLYWLTLAALVLVYALLSLVLQSPFGHALKGIRVNEQRMRACGFSTYGYKLTAFVLAGALAGVAGSLLALREGFVNPEVLSWHLSGHVLVMIVLGGLGSLRGAVLGACVFVVLQELLRYEPIFGQFAQSWQLLLAGSIIICVAFMPKGLIGAFAGMGRKPATAPPALDSVEEVRT